MRRPARLILPAMALCATLSAMFLAWPAAAKHEKPPAVCPEPVKPVLFISPSGEPFRPRGAGDGSGGDDPVKRWFDQADRNHDGKLTLGELMLDGDRFFAALDTDHNGELLPDEVHAYEDEVAPEIKLYQRRPDQGGGSGGGARGERGRGERSEGEQRRTGRPTPAYAAGIMGAGRYAFLNIPNPVAAADGDFNRAISASEFRAAAADRFNDLDPQQTKALTLDRLPKTPAQQAANAACLARLKEQRR